jgi:hypothetical protein
MRLGSVEDRQFCFAIPCILEMDACAQDLAFVHRTEIGLILVPFSTAPYFPLFFHFHDIN